MELIIDDRQDKLSVSEELIEKIKDIIIECLDYEGYDDDYEVSLSFVDNKEIHELNKQFRGIDRPTDVLSFPMVDYEVPGEFDFLEDRDDCFNLETGELVLGDIVISKEKVISQAEEFNHSIKREYAFLIAHSMLHLSGYDHMEEEERSEMERMQRELMEKLNILR